MKSTFKLSERLSRSDGMIDGCESIFTVKIVDVKGVFHLPEKSHNKLEITGDLV